MPITIQVQMIALDLKTPLGKETGYSLLTANQDKSSKSKHHHARHIANQPCHEGYQSCGPFCGIRERHYREYRPVLRVH